MTLQVLQTTSDNSPDLLTQEQRRRVADALENVHSENTLKSYASQFGKFRSWCDPGNFSPFPAQPEVVAAYAECLGEGCSGHSGRVGLAIRMTRRGAPLQAVQTHGRWKSPSMPASYTRSEKALEALEWLV